MSVSTKNNTYLRQMSAVIGKCLSDIESLDGVESIPFSEFDALRRRAIQAMWDSYAVGRLAGMSEVTNAELHKTESRTVDS